MSFELKKVIKSMIDYTSLIILLLISKVGDKMIVGPSIIEPVSEESLYICRMKRLIVSTKTKYQEVQIVELNEFGKALILDGLIQSTESDEHIYHESLVHPVMVTHPKPEKVLIIGGGEGATLREVLKHGIVKKAVMVDIDGELIEFIKEHLEIMHQGSFNDPRSEIVIMDGRKYITEAESSTFDVVILDLTDPHGPEISKSLYSKEFYSEVFRVLKEDGIMVTQAGNSFFYPVTYSKVLDNIKAIFPLVKEYWVWVPSFGYACNYITGSKRYNAEALTSEKIEEILHTRGVKTRFYCGRTHKALMNLPIFYNKFSEKKY